MTEHATGFNPAILRWARERAGLSLENAASIIAKTAADLERWEDGRGAPTYLQLEALAEKAYKRPVAFFFFPAPPEEPLPKNEFRTVPDFDLDSLSADTRFAIRDALAYLSSLRELSSGRNPAEHVITREFHASLDSDIVTLAARVRQYLAVPLDDQFTWSSYREAMTTWRDAVEDKGVFVLKRSFTQKEVAGFCLFDPELPLIMLNNSAPFARQIFTLFHELAHIIFGVSTIAKTSDGFVDRFSGEAKAVEIACNRFAAELLVPAASLPIPLSNGALNLDAIPATAVQYKVSREVILRRFFDRNLVDTSLYSRLVAAWAAEPEKEKGSGGNYYANQASYLGNALLRLAFGQYLGGRITLHQLAEHLNIRAANLGKLEAFLSARE